MAANPFREAFLAGDPALREFYAWPTAPDALAAQLADVLASRQAYEATRHPSDRTTVVDHLRAQYRQWPQTPAATANIEALGQPNTFTVTTGQQPGLFGGPLYTLYKALTAIQVARSWEAKLQGVRVVPVFWIASEDHDYAEVNHTWQRYDHKLSYPGDFGGGPVGRHVITDAILPLLAALEAALPPDAFALLADAWQPGRGWADAFGRWLHGVLGPLGLVVLDADAPELKRLFGRTLLEQLEMELNPKFESGPALLRAQTEKLAHAGWPGPLHPAPSLLFWLGDGGVRRRLDPLPGGQGWQLHGTQIQYEKEVLMKLVNDQPHSLSPNAALRPLYQERLLPNLAYVGGWAELHYWGQLRTLFDAHRIPMPALLPRHQLLLLTQSQQAEMDRLGLNPEAIGQPLTALRTHLANADGMLDAFDAIAAQHGPAFDALAAFLDANERSLSRRARSLRAQTARHYAQLRKKLIKQQLQHNPQAQTVLALHSAIQPEGLVQERVLGWVAFGLMSAQSEKILGSLAPIETSITRHATDIK